MELISPRERAGHDSIANEAPAGHSAPMPMPSNARKKNRNAKLGEKPAMKLQIEYHRIEIISGVFRPTRSASQPDAVAPRSRSHRVTANTAVTAVKGTPNSCEIGSMINRKIVKSKESNVQPSHAATQAYHWSLVGSFHHGTSGTGLTISTVAMPHLPVLQGWCQKIFASRLRPTPPAQASTRSGTSSFPLVSGLSSSAIMKLRAPKTVPISIGIAKPSCQVVAK